MMRQITIEQILGMILLRMIESGQRRLNLAKLYQLEKLVDAEIREHNNACVSSNSSLHNLLLSNNDIFDVDEKEISLKNNASRETIYSRFVKGIPKDIINTATNVVQKHF